MRERGTELKGRYFCFLRLSFSILQPRRQARCTCPQPWDHPFQDNLNPRLLGGCPTTGLGQSPQATELEPSSFTETTFRFQATQMEQEKALQPVLVTCFDRGQHSGTSSNAISSLRKRTEKACLDLPRLSWSREQ